VSAALSPFDALAASYDDSFTRGAIGGRLRRALWRSYDRLFTPGMRVLDLGSGTGADALHLAERGVCVLGVDAAPAMVSAAEAKARAAGLGNRATFRVLPLERLSTLDGAPFDGAYSSFGPLNCLEDLGAFGEALARLLVPGAPVVLCLMGRLVPWEWAFYLSRGEGMRAFRRLRRGGSEWRGITVRYPTPAAARRALGPVFRVRRTWALGALLPPTYVEAWAARHPRLLDGLDAIERRIEALPGLASLADHYVLELVRAP